MNNNNESNLINRKKQSNTSSPSSSSSIKTDQNISKSTNNSNKPAKESNKFSLLSLIANNTFLIILAVRSLSSYYNQVWDCDETYNYWEPLHFLLFGNGFQTWEYSPKYALRSYLYIYLHALPIWPFVSFVANKITLFYILRFVFALISSYLESYLYDSLRIRFKKSNISLYYLLFTLTNVGMFASSTTFLPSTFSMYLCMLAYGSFLRSNFKTSIFAIGLATLLGWPFVVILGIPIAIHIILFRQDEKQNSIPIFYNLIFFIKWTLLFAVLISAPIIAVDSYLFGKFVFAPFNIVKYNVFPSNPNIGPDIYGREPFSFYILNCLLNFNILFPMSTISGVLLWFDYYHNKKSKLEDVKNANNNNSVASQNERLNRYSRFIMFGAYLWMSVFFTRPHKEERFLYPIYPLLLIGAGIALNFVHTNLKKLVGSSIKVFSIMIDLIPVVVVVLHAIFSVSRGLALHKNYYSSIQIYKELNQPSTKFTSPHLQSKELINVCVSKEWYRFPSNFFIPEDLTLNTQRQRWRLAFLESDFKGQLPGYYNESLKIPQSTRKIDRSFNDENKEVKSRYIPLTKCDYFIDTDDKYDDKNVHLYHNKKNTNTKWKTLARLPFLDANGMAEDKFFRSFYVPFYYEKKVKINYFKLRIRLP